MNILLDAYLDKNFGDDLFVETITKLYPTYKFYAFMEYYPTEIQRWVAEIPNLYILPVCSVILQKGFFDAYICVGGDIFPDDGDFTDRRKWVDAVHTAGGKIIFLGFSLFHRYGEKTKNILMQLMGNADLIAPRDQRSADILREMLPEKEITVMADLAFAAEWPIRENSMSSGGKTLGIAVRRPEKKDEAAMKNYCESLNRTIEEFLKEDMRYKVLLLALSDGKIRDSEVAEAIRHRTLDPSRVDIAVYQGNLQDMKRTISMCDMVICTRFHAMVASIMMHIPFIPINYEVKMEHLLEEIGYTGIKVGFEDVSSIESFMRENVGNTNISCWNEGKCREYAERGRQVIKRLTQLLEYNGSGGIYVKRDTTGTVCQEKSAVVECQKTIRDYLQTINESQEIIGNYLQTITECRKTIEDYLQTISELRNTNEAYLDQITELNRIRQNIETELKTQSCVLAEERERFQEKYLEMERKQDAFVEEIKVHKENSTKKQEELERLAEEKKLMQSELGSVREDLENKIRLLEYLRPYFSGGCMGKVMKLMGTVVKGKTAVKIQWKELENYFLE